MQIIIDDALAHLKTYIKEGRKFDYVFGDLTDVPISDSPHDELWTFMRDILNMGIKVLKPDGKYLTHVSLVGKYEIIYEKIGEGARGGLAICFGNVLKIDGNFLLQKGKNCGRSHIYVLT